MNIRTLIALSVVPVGLTGCLQSETTGECDSESRNFTAQDEEVLAQHVMSTWDYTQGVAVDEIPCEQVCIQVVYDPTLPEASVSSCEMTLDTDYFSGLSEDTADTGLDETVVGSVTCTGTLFEYYCMGRRPLGHIEVQSKGAGLGRYLAHAAHLEAASVHAFSQLAAQLEAWGAPVDLVSRARRAMADEVQHAREVARLAKALGHTPAPALREPIETDLLTVAIHNATEGCVSETWAALEAHLIAGKAADAAIREVFAQIAEDETRHAQLSWDLHAWLCAQLSPSQQKLVQDAQQRAIAELAETALEHLSALPKEFGLTELAGADALVARFTQGLAA